MPRVGHKVDCTCCPGPTPAAQSLDEVAFSRSACAAAMAGNQAKLADLISKNPAALHDDGCQGNSGFTPLHYAARAGHAEVVAWLLKEGGDPNKQTSAGGATPLHRAAFMGWTNIVTQLLQAGADPLIQDADGKIAYHKAKQAGHVECAQLLRQYCPAHGKVVEDAK